MARAAGFAAVAKHTQSEQAHTKTKEPTSRTPPLFRADGASRFHRIHYGNLLGDAAGYIRVSEANPRIT